MFFVSIILHLWQRNSPQEYTQLHKVNGSIKVKKVPNLPMQWSKAGVLNRGEISPMGEILGIQGGNESV